jgi:hypothetical protein
MGQLAIGQRIAYTSQLSHACCQKRWTKSADLLRTQAGRPLVIRVLAECTTAVSGLPNHFLNFDGILWQHFSNQWNRFYIESPPVCTIVAIKGPILKF